MTFNIKYTASMPALVDQEFDDMLKDIAIRGILVQIIIDEHHNVLDGAHRLKCAAILGLKMYQL